MYIWKGASLFVSRIDIVVTTLQMALSGSFVSAVFEDLEPEDEETPDESSDAASDEEISEGEDPKDGDFHLPEELDCVSGDAIFMGQVCAIDDMIEQINLQSRCKATFNCKGIYQRFAITRSSLGGAVEMEYRCSLCKKRGFTFTSSSKHVFLASTVVGVALQVAFIAAGLTYRKYQLAIAAGLGLKAVSNKAFDKTLQYMRPVVKNQLDKICSQAKEEMKRMDPSETGSWKNAVTSGDACWLTRGFFSQNATVIIQNYTNNALLYYTHLSQRGSKDETLHMGTSKAAEGEGLNKLFEQASNEGMHISAHVQDNDSSSIVALREHFKDDTTSVMLCAGHCNRAQQKRLKSFAKSKMCSATFIKDYIKQYPMVETVKCHCTKHSKKCGCMSSGFLHQAKMNLTQCLYNAGSNEKVFAESVSILGRLHCKDIHSDCTFHEHFVCSCGKCSETKDFKCTSKPYKSHFILTCPYHQLMYEIDCLEQIVAKSSSLIHPTLGQLRTNATESCFNTLTRFRSKCSHLTCMHYEVSTNLGLIHANLTRLINTDETYHWYFDLYEALKLPIFCGMAWFLKKENIARLKKTDYIKTVECKRKRNRWKTQHRTYEQDERKNNLKRRKVYHTYGDEEVNESNDEIEENADELEYKPKNEIKKQRKGSIKYVDKQISKGNGEIEIDEDDESLTEQCRHLCKCPNPPSHTTSCPLHFGKSQEDRIKILVAYIDQASAKFDDVEITGSYIHPHKPDCITPTHSWMTAASNFLSDILCKLVSINEEQLIHRKLAGISPLCRHRIKGDGNCLFRAMSKFVLGTESSHLDLRNSIVAFMELPDNSHQFEQRFGFGPKLRYTSIHNYIEQSRINDVYTYGTDFEIIVFATMMQAKVMVYSCQHSTWCQYEPIFSNSTCLSHKERFLLHIIHEKEHYDLCVPPISA